MSDVTDAAALQAEVERLRKANASLTRKVAWRQRFRRASASGLLLLGCGLAVLSLVAIWLRVTMLDTDRYVDTVAPIAAQPAVQDAVADKLETAIFSRVDFAALSRQALPDQADVIAPAIERGLQSFISDRIVTFTRSPRFQELWTEANRRAHTRIVALLTGGRSGRLVLEGDTVYLDLSEAVNRVRDGLSERGLNRLADAIPSTVDGQVPLMQSDALVSAQGGVRLLKGVAIVLPVLSLLCLAGAVALARRRRRALLWVGIGLALSMVLLIAALGVARSAYLDALDQGTLPHNAAASIFDVLVALLRDGVRVVVIAALVLALISFVAGFPLRAYATRSWTRFANSGARRWIVARHRTLQFVAGGLGMFVLLAWDPLTGRVVLFDLLIVGAVVGGLAALAAGSEPAEELRADDQRDDGHDRGVVGGHP